MSTRTNLSPQKVITNGNMSGNLTSNPTILKSLSKVSYQYVWTGTSPVGTVAVQGSDDYLLNPNGSVENAGTWTTLTLTDNTGTPVQSLPVTGNSGNGMIDLETGIYALRTIYTAGSGSGTLNVTVNAKVA
jgi:hypothetical protein